MKPIWGAYYPISAYCRVLTPSSEAAGTGHCCRQDVRLDGLIKSGSNSYVLKETVVSNGGSISMDRTLGVLPPCFLILLSADLDNMVVKILVATWVRSLLKFPTLQALVEPSHFCTNRGWLFCLSSVDKALNTFILFWSFTHYTITIICRNHMGTIGFK